MLNSQAIPSAHMAAFNGNEMRQYLVEFRCMSPAQCSQEFFQNNVTKFHGWDPDLSRHVHVTIRNATPKEGSK